MGVGIGEGIVVGTALRPDSGEAEGSMLDAFVRGLRGGGGGEVTNDEGGEEET